MKDELKEELAKIKASEKTTTDKESLVGDAYTNAWLRYMKGKKIKADNTRIHKCDAFWIGKNNILVEYKYDIDMENPVERAKVLAQVIAYYREIINDKRKNKGEKGKKVNNPSVLFVADVNECFAMHVNYINKFVNIPGIKWIAPSKMGNDSILINAIANDEEIENQFKKGQSIVFNTSDPDFSEEKIFEKINDIAEGVVRIVPITENTIKMGFEYFSEKIVDSNKYTGNANKLVGMYFEFIKKEAGCFVKGNKLYFSGKYNAVQILSTERANQFRSRFGEFSEDDKRELERMYDTLVSDYDRRRNGQFFTPKIWVDKAHERMARVLGDNWESTVPTWDCCCGTKSLTRDYEFGELYLSTLEQAELNASDKLSTEARETFVFDFLNDSDSKLPKSLKDALKKAKKNGERFAMIINPPYAQATSGNKSAHKDGVSDTEIGRQMSEKELGKAANELTVQFLYRIMEIVKDNGIKDFTLGLFSNPAWLTGDACEKFREEWLKIATFDNGFGFRSEEFEGVKPGWAINFSVWKLSV